MAMMGFRSKPLSNARITGRLAGAFVVFCSTLSAPLLAQDFFSTIPSTNYRFIRTPYSPTSMAECDAVSQEFQAHIQQLNAQHDACLQGAPGDDGSSGSCSKSSCQAVHSARDDASKRHGAEVSTCRRRVNDYLAEQRLNEQRRRQAEQEEREQAAARQREREARDRERDRERDRDRQAREQDRRQDDARREREEQDRLARQDADRAARDRRAREEKDARDQQEAKRLEQERAQQEAALAYALAQQEYQRQVAAQQAEQARAAKLKKEASDYVEMLARVKRAQDTASDLEALGKNPFATIAEKAADSVSSALVDKAVDAAVPLGREGTDERYDAIAQGTDEVRSSALASNPFAAKVSSLAAQGVQKIHKKILGETETLVEKFDAFDQSSPARGNSPTVRATPAPARDNPFRQGQPAKRNTAVAATRGVDERQGITRETPGRPRTSSDDLQPTAGRSFYRPASDEPLLQLAENEIPASTEGDRVENGVVKCSKTGIGRVIPECERKRRNPFAK
jgi:hypothetical protein